jgi:hypothetical protein
MGIKFRCHACDKKLHVKSFLAGKRGVCPKCGAKVRIPLAGEESSPASSAGRDTRRHAANAASFGSALAAHGNLPAAAPQEMARAGAPASSVGRVSAGSGVRATSVHDPIAEAPDAVWYVRPPTGGQFGPADGAIMRRWLNEGRVSADALVWREGWPDWKSAGPIFPSLEGPDLLAAASSASAVVDEVDGDFVLAEERRAAGRHTPRSRSKPVGRNVTIVVMLVVLCIAMLAALIFVLRADG